VISRSCARRSTSSRSGPSCPASTTPARRLITINAQAGGADAADWAEGLRRIYLRWAERHGYSSEVYDTSYAEEAGIKSTTFVIKAPYAYGTLAVSTARTGWCASPSTTTQGRRQTSFAGWT